MKLQIKSNEQAVITVPKHLRKAKGWEGGEEIEFYLMMKAI
jgi:bifunctional DNA-binding transcriptional regulator/antitoxin component of YhaV-PrlF toxin-antitoxin module